MAAFKMRNLKKLCRNPFWKLLFFMGVCLLTLQFILKYWAPSVYNSDDYMELNIKEANALTEDKIYIKDEYGDREGAAEIRSKLEQYKHEEDVAAGKNDKDVDGNHGDVVVADKNDKDVDGSHGDDVVVGKNNKDVDGNHGNDVVASNEGDIQGNEDKDVKDSHDSDSQGYHGEAVVVDKTKLSPEELVKYNDGWKKYAFNNYVSNMISVDRPLYDLRDKQCLPIEYPKYLPATSVIICFHNEAWSVLIRTIHSVIHKSPRQLIHEIILVDDASKFDHLKAPLEEHVIKLPVPVKIVRSSTRQGLIRGRLLGYEVATGETLTFLDSHCECTDGWLEPLMSRIADNKTNVVCPVISVIDKDTFIMHNSFVRDMSVGIFDWMLTFKWGALTAQEKAKRKSPVSPMASPTMAGGLFSINREYFKYLGTYDEKMDVWGGENLELSFRIWMCGGRLEQIPCSIVGHVFRDRPPYSATPGSFLKNTLRVAMVWLDEYKDLYLNTLGRRVLPDYGDISNRVALRKRLNCKSFHWYMNNVYTNAFIPSKAKIKGKLYNHANSNMCLDSMGDFIVKNKHVQWLPCTNSTNQIWYYVAEVPEIRQLTTCLDVGSADEMVTLYSCHGMHGNQDVALTDKGAIHFRFIKKCLQAFTSNLTLGLRDCDGSESQMWSWKT